MAICKACGGKVGFLDGGNGFCGACFAKRLSAERNNEELPATEYQLSEEKRNAEVESVLPSTEAMLVGIRVSRRIGIVTAECAYGRTSSRACPFGLARGVEQAVAGLGVGGYLCQDQSDALHGPHVLC